MRAMGYGLWAAGLSLWAGAASAQSWKTMSASRELRGESDMTINVQYGAGHFHLGPGESSELYRLQMRYDENKTQPVREYDAGRRVLRLGVRDVKAHGFGIHSGRHSDPPPSFDLQLSPDVPLTLNLQMGAVAAEADLGGLSLRRATLQTGASTTRLSFGHPNPVACDELTLEAGAAEFRAEKLANSNCGRVVFRGGVGDVTLDFGGAWRRSMSADVSVGIGGLNLKLPRDVGVAVHLSRFLASFDAAGFVKRGNTYYSTNYDTAQNRLTLNVNASLGEVGVSWLN